MKRWVFLSIVIASVLAACGGDDEASAGAGGGSGEAGSSGEGGESGQGGQDAGQDAGDDAGDPDAGDGDGDGDSGSGGTGGSFVGEPVIPEPMGECPDFTTGRQTVLGMETDFLVGEVGAVKGPLLINWHGTGGNGNQALAQLPQSVKDDIVARGGVIIAPNDNEEVREGQDVTFILNVWYDIQDLEYADHLVACAVQNHNIDPRQIYVTGCSAGGLMTGVMALTRSGYVAAAAPNSGGVPTPSWMLGDPDHVPPIFAMHGGEEDTVYVNFGMTSRSLGDQINEGGGLFVECNHMIGHCLAPPELYESAWEFMKAHPFGVTPEPLEMGLPDDYPDYCSIYE
jgi:predicted esterase